MNKIEWFLLEKKYNFDFLNDGTLEISWKNRSGIQKGVPEKLKIKNISNAKGYFENIFELNKDEFQEYCKQNKG